MSYGILGGGFDARLGADPEIDEAKGMARLRLAIQMNKDYTEWVNLDVWGKNLSYVAGFKKGDMAHVHSSQLTTRVSDKGEKFLNLRCSTGDLSLTHKEPRPAGAGGADDLPF